MECHQQTRLRLNAAASKSFFESNTFISMIQCSPNSFDDCIVTAGNQSPRPKSAPKPTVVCRQQSARKFVRRGKSSTGQRVPRTVVCRPERRRWRRYFQRWRMGHRLGGRTIRYIVAHSLNLIAHLVYTVFVHLFRKLYGNSHEVQGYTAYASVWYIMLVTACGLTLSIF